MTDQRDALTEEPATGRARPLASAIAGPEGGEITPAMRAQFVATEHWSLLATRSLSWNEAFARAGMFLSLLSGAVVALALVAQVTAFGEAFTLFALLLLPVVLFVGLATFVRLVEINNEDALWVIGMNRLRRAYLDAAPELQPHFVTGTTDDIAGIMQTFAAREGPGTFTHSFVTTPGMLAVVVAVLGGVLAGLVVTVLSMGTSASLGTGVLGFIVVLCLLLAYQYRSTVRLATAHTALFPGPGQPPPTRT